MFLLPSGRAGRSFIDEIVRLLNCLVEGITLDNVAFVAVMIKRYLGYNMMGDTDEDTEALPLADAANIFNSVNREVSLNSIFIICPAIATCLRNCHIIRWCMFIIMFINVHRWRVHYYETSLL